MRAVVVWHTSTIRQQRAEVATRAGAATRYLRSRRFSLMR